MDSFCLASLAQHCVCEIFFHVGGYSNGLFIFIAV